MTVSTVVTNGIAQCAVATSLVVRDLDYDVVRYRARWRVGGAVRCEVTPSDGKLSAPTVSAPA